MRPARYFSIIQLSNSRAIGLPGDASPASRFVKASFLKWNSVCDQDEATSISQFFHILNGVSIARGSVRTEAGKYETTIYTCCIRPQEGIYYPIFDSWITKKRLQSQ